MKGRLLGLAVLATATMANAAAQLEVRNLTVAEELTKVGYTTTNASNIYRVSDQDIKAEDGDNVLTSRIKLTVNGANFSVAANKKIYLCSTDPTVTDNYGESSDSGLNNNVSITIKKKLTAGGTYYFVIGTGCNDANKQPIQYSLSNLTDGQTVTLTITGIGDAAVKADASAVVATIKKQFTTKVDPITAKIDLKTFKNFVIGVSSIISTTMKAPFRIISNEAIDEKIGLTGGHTSNCDWKLDNGWIADFTLKGKLQEYSTITILSTNNNPIIQKNITADDRKNGQVTIADFGLYSAGIVCKSPLAMPTYIQLKVDGQNQIQEDTKKLTIKLKNGSKSISDLVTDADVFKVKLDATTLYVPLVGYVPAVHRDTYIKLQMVNNTVPSADVIFQVLASDGSIVTTKIQGKDQLKAGDVLVIDGSEIVNAVKAAGKTLYKDGESFAVKIIITAPASDIFAYANIVDNGGNTIKRVPVKVLYDLNDQNERARFIAE